MTAVTLQMLWYIFAIAVSAVTMLIYLFKFFKFLRQRKISRKDYSKREKLDYYQKRSKDKRLSYSQREYARKKLKKWV